MKLHSLSNLLAHEIVDLYSAETQIIEALPKMIDKAQNAGLKKALQEHLAVTEQQKKRLEKIHKMLKQDGSAEEELGDTKCLGMKGLIDEGKKSMNEEMEPDVMDAAIIACAQKIEHYEISGYGTARAFARELGLAEIEKLLKQTLDEEYSADDLLTSLAVGQVNDAAEEDEDDEISVKKIPAKRSTNGRSKTKAATGRTKKSASKTARKKSTSSTAKKTSTKSSSSKSRGRK